MRSFYFEISPKNQRDTQICKRIRVNCDIKTHKKKGRSRNEGVNDAPRIKKKTHTSQKKKKFNILKRFNLKENVFVVKNRLK
jgi:hypothetical protein